MTFTEITLSINLFCSLPINDEINTSFTLLSLHCQPIFTTQSSILFFVSCLFPILLQPMCSTKTSGVSSFKVGSAYASICFRVAPISGLNRILHLLNFELNFFLRIPLIIYNYVFLPNFTALFKIFVARYNKRCRVLYMVMKPVSIQIFINYRDGIRVFRVAKFFICKSPSLSFNCSL